VRALTGDALIVVLGGVVAGFAALR